MYKRCMKSIAVVLLLISLISISSAALPTAMPDIYKGQCGVQLSVPAPGILGNDLKSTKPLQVIFPEKITIDPKYGTLMVSADGSFVYDPVKNFPIGSTVNFYYKATDGITVTNQALVKITVSCVCRGAAPDVYVCPGTKITSEFLMSQGAGCIGCRDATPKFDLSKIPAQPVAGQSYPYTVTCPDCAMVTGHIFQGPCTITSVPFTVCSETTPTADQIKDSGKVKCSCVDTDPAISDIIQVGNQWKYTITCQSKCGPTTATGIVNIEESCVPTIDVSFPISTLSCPNHDIPTSEDIIKNGGVSCSCGGTLLISGVHWITRNDTDPSDWVGEYTATCRSANGCEKSDVGQFTSADCALCTPASCDDGNACTTDSCDPATGCTNEPVVCNDGNACTTDSCNPDTGCTTTPVVCNDGNACTTDSCNPATGCTTTPVVCNDGNVCNGVETCDDATGCVPGENLNCDDTNVCTTDSCNQRTGCVNTANTAPCDDGNACTTGDVCANKVCKSGTTTLDCNDQNVCTTDSCDKNGGCQHTPLNQNKECDGIACTTPDRCSNGECVPGPLCPGVCNDNSKCTDDACVAGIGCVYTNTCTDGQVCCSLNGGTCVSSCGDCKYTCAA